MAADWPGTWKRARLGDVADVNWGDTSVTKASYVETGFCAYSASGPDGFLPYADFSCVGVVLSAIGADCGRTWLAKGEWSCIKNTLRFWATSPEVDTAFLYWLTRDPEVWPKRGSAQPFISQGDARALEVAFPSLRDQRAIAHILGSLDDKIDLNRRMNETLEALARAIFDEMFGEEAPDAVVGDLAGIERDSVNPMDHEDELFDHYSLPAFDESRRPVRERGGNIKSNKFIVKAGAVLLSKLNPSIPRVWYPRVRQGPRSIASTEFQVMRSRATSSPEFLYCLLRSEPIRDHLVGLASGTSNSHQRVKPDDLLATPCPMPSPEGLDRFTRAVRPMLERVNAGIDESSTLAALRDTLLPKLLSGELRIPDAEKMVEAAT